MVEVIDLSEFSEILIGQYNNRQQTQKSIIAPIEIFKNGYSHTTSYHNGSTLYVVTATYVSDTSIKVSSSATAIYVGVFC